MWAATLAAVAGGGRLRRVLTQTETAPSVFGRSREPRPEQATSNRTHATERPMIRRDIPLLPPSSPSRPHAQITIARPLRASLPRPAQLSPVASPLAPPSPFPASPELPPRRGRSTHRPRRCTHPIISIHLIAPSLLLPSPPAHCSQSAEPGQPLSTRVRHRPSNSPPPIAAF